MKKLTCRLTDLMWAKHTDAEALSEQTGISVERLTQYSDNALEVINLREVEAIMAALGCRGISDLYDLVEDAPEPYAPPPGSFDEWHTPCPKGGRHDWYKDVDFSNSVYQEYECRACGKRIHVIW